MQCPYHTCVCAIKRPYIIVRDCPLLLQSVKACTRICLSILHLWSNEHCWNHMHVFIFVLFMFAQSNTQSAYIVRPQNQTLSCHRQLFLLVHFQIGTYPVPFSWGYNASSHQTWEKYRQIILKWKYRYCLCVILSNMESSQSKVYLNECSDCLYFSELKYLMVKSNRN